VIALHALGRPTREWARWLMLVGAIAAMAAALMVGHGAAARPEARPSLALASASAPFSGSSPATTVATVPTAPASPATTIPIAHTGEAWGSQWFMWLLLLSVLLGFGFMQPLFWRRPQATA